MPVSAPKTDPNSSQLSSSPPSSPQPNTDIATGISNQIAYTSTQIMSILRHMPAVFSSKVRSFSPSITHFAVPVFHVTIDIRHGEKTVTRSRILTTIFRRINKAISKKTQHKPSPTLRNNPPLSRPRNTNFPVNNIRITTQ